MRLINLLALIVMAISVALGLINCGGNSGTNGTDTGPKPGGSSSTTMGPLGGSISYGEVVAVFPAGALSTVEIVQVGIPETEPDYTLPDSLTKIGYLYEVGPADVVLNVPVSIAFLYDDSALDSLAETTLQIWSVDADSDAITPLGDIYIDAAENTITGSTDHLGYFILTVATDTLLNLSPPAPQLIAPYDMMPENALHVTLRWKDIGAMNYYHVQVAEDENFLGLFYDGPGITGGNVSLSGLSPNQTYYWRVQGHNECGYGEWSQVWSFSTGGGEYPQTIEGTWQLIRGEFHPSGIYYDYRLDIEVWGNLIISFGNGKFNAEGERGIRRYWDWSLDTTYLDYVTEEGTYDLEEYSINVYISCLQDAWMAPATSGEYSVSIDTLTLTYYPGTGFYPVEGQLDFHRI